MDMSFKRKCYKVSTILGSSIILLTNGVVMIWGNMSVYVLSYVLFNVSSESNLEAPWIVSLFIGFWTGGLLVHHFVASFIGIRWTALLGMFITDLGFVASYFVVHTSLSLLNVTLGVLTGLGTGLIHASALQILLQWADKKIGFIVSFLQGSFYMGALILNQVITAYVNPDNAAPDLRLGHSVYYTNVDIINKAPNSFLILFGFSIPCHLLGLSLMKDNTFDAQNTSDCRDRRGDNSTDPASGYFGECSPSQPRESAQTQRTDGPAPTEFKRLTGSSTTTTDAYENANNEDFSPKQVLRCPSFYAMWIAFFVAEIPFLLLSNYYKSFGQLWIPDDHFLTNLGVTMSFLNSWLRILWGVIMDKIGVKNCLVLEISLLVIISMWYYFTPRLDRWLYFLLTISLSSLTGAHYGACIYVVVFLFGKTHFSVNYGLLRSSAITINFLAPVLIEYVLTTFGWFYVFSSVGFLNLLSLFLVFRYI